MYALTSLLDTELHRSPRSSHGARRLALVLALVMGCNPSDAESTGRQDYVAAVKGQWAAPTRPGNDWLRVSARIAGKVHCLTLQDRLVLRCHCELWNCCRQKDSVVFNGRAVVSQSWEWWFDSQPPRSYFKVP